MRQKVMTGDDTPVINAIPVRHYGRWISALVVGVLVAMLINGLVTNEKYMWDVVGANLFAPNILRAVGWTLVLTVAAMTIGITLAVTLAIMRRSENPVLRSVATAYIWFFRGTPIYTQLVFWGLIGVLYPRMALGIPFGPEFVSFNTYSVFTAAVAAMLGLGLNEGAYLSEIVRSGLNSVEAGQEEAAKALGMSNGQILRRIIVPQAMRVIVPPTGNETISMLKTTSLVLAVPFTLDLTYVTNTLGNSSFRPIPFLLIAAIWYLTITSILMIGQHFLEKYYGKGTVDSQQRAPVLFAGAKRRQQRVSRQAAINAAGTVYPDTSGLGG